MNILVTGGAGYIGSHTIIELLNNNHTVTVVDNLINSSAESLKRIQEITGKTLSFHEFDVRNEEKLDAVFATSSIDAVIHFAGLKAVGESTTKPLLYYQTNIDSTLILLKIMEKYGVTDLVFSSSATVYGSAPVPYSELSPTGIGITNPYGRTKYMIEEILKDVAAANPKNRFTALRYFNPVGAHPSGKIGEDPLGIPNNLMPYVARVAAGKREKLGIFGNDYETTDGTGIRDYIHVVDLARGHRSALDNLTRGFSVYNIGSGVGVSVLELVKAFEKASEKSIPYEFMPRRPGDLATSYADPAKAAQTLGWKAELSVTDACRDTWNWQSQNPNGYTD